MKNETNQTTPLWAQAADFPWIKGPALGASVSWMVTPLLKWTNHTLNNEKMPLKNPFSGAMSYATSAIPGYAVTFALKALLAKSPEETSSQYDLLTSFTAGGFSGLACTPFEVLAQNKQLTQNPSLQATARQMLNTNGYRAFFRGGASMMLREGLWSTVYLTAIPMATHYFEAKGMQKRQAALLAMLSVAGTYGLFSSPLNRLRFKKAQGLTEPGANKSYLAHAQAIWNQKPEASHAQRLGFFFKASLPRAITTTVAAGLVVKGAESYNQMISAFKK